MRIGIRKKLVGLLVLVAVLPLTTALVTLAVGGRKLRRRSVGKTICAMAASKATVLGVSLSKDLEKLHLVLIQSTKIVSAAEGGTRKLGDAKLKELDARWPTMSLKAEPMARILGSRAAGRLRDFQAEDARLAELLMTDRFGQLVAATGRTTDFYQADEDWWRGAWHGGKGRIYLPEVTYDASTGVWSIDLCVPIRRRRTVVGVAKAVLDVSQWVYSGRGEHKIDGENVSLMLLRRRDGMIIQGPDIEPLSRRANQWSGGISTSARAGWRLTRDGIIQGYAPVHLPELVGGHRVVGPRWLVVFQIPQARALRAVHRLILVLLLIGLAVIGLVFLVGLVIVERGVVRRLGRLGRATREVARGDLTHRVALPQGSSGFVVHDEIDELADDFNRMVDRVEHSHEVLRKANELKTNFIRVASHELRTPVSYILATVKLLRESTDSHRLLYAVQIMGAKAKRLDNIIQAMFKLMPNEQYAEHLHCTDVNVAELLEEVYLDAFPFVENRRQQLRIDGAATAPPLHADREKLRDILENLVLNAVKFTPDGGVVKVTVGQEPGSVSFTVRDQGPGIPEMELSHVFDPFYSGGDVMKHSSGQSGFQKRGIGLGLAIVKHFVELHGGTVRAESGPGGSTFHVVIPTEPRPGPAGDSEKK